MSTDNMTTATTENKKKFVISNLVVDNEPFDQITDSKFLTSTKLCELISSMLRNIYADYEGCNMEFLPGNNIPSITLYFNHRDNSASLLPCACSKEDLDVNAKNSTLQMTRRWNNRLLNGDRYYLTEEGHALDEFLYDQFFISAKNGERVANWNKLVSETSDNNFVFQGINQQYTQVRGLDPAKLVEAIFGKMDKEKKTEYVYAVMILRSIPSFNMMGGMSSSGFVVSIQRVSKNEVETLAKQFGLNTNAGLNIIR